MKIIKTIIVASIAVTILFSACAVEKRRYRKGYNVEAKSKKPKSETTETKAETATTPTATTTTPAATTPATTVNTTPAPTTATAPTTTVAPSGINTSYKFSVVVGPRPDKKKVQAKHKPH